MDFIGDIVAAPFICLGWIIVGGLAGGLARNLLDSPDKSFVTDVVLGIAGALVGGLLAGLLGLAPGADDVGLALVCTNFIVATIGAMVLIAARRALPV